MFEVFIGLELSECLGVKEEIMKIYCVLFDTLPLFGKLVSVAKSNGMELLRQVGGCFTTTTCVQMFTGKLPSDLEENGIGYELCGQLDDYGLPESVHPRSQSRFARRRQRPAPLFNPSFIEQRTGP